MIELLVHGWMHPTLVEARSTFERPYSHMLNLDILCRDTVGQAGLDARVSVAVVELPLAHP